MLPFALMLAALVEGNVQSPVRVLIYEDLQCQDCADFRQALDEHILLDYQDRVAFEHRDFPLPKHKWARPAALASRFFAERDPAIALDYRRQTLANVRGITPANFEANLAEFARAHAIDPVQAIAALSDKRLIDLVETDYQNGVARGIAHTPTVLIGTTAFIENVPLPELRKALDDALAQSRR